MTNQLDIAKVCEDIVIVSDSTKAECNALCERAKTITVVENDAHARIAGAIVRDMKSLRKIIGDERKGITKVLDDAKKKIMSIEKTAVANLESETERISTLANDYVAREKAKIEAQNTQNKIASEMFGDNVKQEEVKVQGVRSRETWDFEIVNEYMIPRDYCSPDASIIRNYIKQVRDGGSSFDSLYIPGIRFVKKTTVY